MRDAMIRVRGNSCGLAVTVYAYQREGEYQCPICMRLLATDDFLIAHTVQQHPRAVKGPTS